MLKILTLRTGSPFYLFNHGVEDNWSAANFRQAGGLARVPAWQGYQTILWHIATSAGDPEKKLALLNFPYTDSLE